MKLSKSFKHALNMVLHSKLRSWLTILGIVIGVAAVISIISLGNALEADVNSQFDQLGGDLLTLSAGASRASGFGPPGFGGSGSSATKEGEEIELTRQDLQVLKGLQEIKTLDTQISGNADIYYVAEKGSVRVTGVDQTTWAQITTESIAEGRMLGSADSNVIVISGGLADGYFDKNLGVNQLVTIEDKLFRIVGILDNSGTSIYMPLSSAYQVIEDKEINVYDSIIIQVKDEETIDDTIELIEKKLAISRHTTVAEKDFSISSNKAQQEQRSEFLSSMTLFLTAIAAVALLVGSVGIANTMFTSVLEKTKEIGIMKAIGARNNDILTIFLLNAALIGLIGGLLGLFLGSILSGVLPSLLGGSGIFGRAGNLVVNVETALFAIGISVVIGVVAGMIPAYKASRLKPVDALRYE